MKICRFFEPDRGPRLGLIVEDTVHDLTSSGLPYFDSLTALLQASVETPIEMLVRYTDALKADGVENMPTAERIDGKTVKFVLGDYLTAHRAFVASVNIASAVSR